MAVQCVHQQAEKVFNHCRRLAELNEESTVGNLVRLLLFQKEEGFSTLSIDEFPDCGPRSIRDIFMPELAYDRAARPEEASVFVVFE